jgi:C_GCAxxG_C_C family probable redox protein
MSIPVLLELPMNTMSITNVRKDAERSFATGLYCAESVLLAIARAQGLESELIPKIATAFCSGMSRSCSTCGALTGGVMGISLVLGRSSASDSVEPSYQAAQRLIREFKDEFGDCDCYTLLGGCDMNTPEGQATFQEKGLMEDCLNITGKAAEMAARIIVESKDQN